MCWTPLFAAMKLPTESPLALVAVAPKIYLALEVPICSNLERARRTSLGESKPLKRLIYSRNSKVVGLLERLGEYMSASWLARAYLLIK